MYRKLKEIIKMWSLTSNSWQSYEVEDYICFLYCVMEKRFGDCVLCQCWAKFPSLDWVYRKVLLRYLFSYMKSFNFNFKMFYKAAIHATSSLKNFGNTRQQKKSEYIYLQIHFVWTTTLSNEVLHRDNVILLFFLSFSYFPPPLPFNLLQSCPGSCSHNSFALGPYLPNQRKGQNSPGRKWMTMAFWGWKATKRWLWIKLWKALSAIYGGVNLT